MHMQVQIRSIHFDADERLIAFVEGKVSVSDIKDLSIFYVFFQ